MSQPPAYGADPSTKNPDDRPLPPGWITQYDKNYNAWFYVNTSANPPVTTWTHPLGPPPPVASPPPSQFSPPPGPPPPNQHQHNYNQPPPQNYGYGNPQGQYSGYNGGYQQNSGYNPSGYPQPPPQQPWQPSPQHSNYGGYPQQQGYPDERSGGGGIAGKLGSMLGGGSHGGGSNKFGGFMGGGSHGGSYGGYGHPPPQQVYVQQKPQKSGPGMGTMLAAGGAGLLGGALIGGAIADSQMDAYQEGFEDGAGGDDFDF